MGGAQKRWLHRTVWHGSSGAACRPAVSHHEKSSGEGEQRATCVRLALGCLVTLAQPC
eukprot:COSAG06_NODE_56719_length_283_cov_0.978261_1_plen_57_part_01